MGSRPRAREKEGGKTYPSPHTRFSRFSRARNLLAPSFQTPATQLVSVIFYIVCPLLFKALKRVRKRVFSPGQRAHEISSLYPLTPQTDRELSPALLKEIVILGVTKVLKDVPDTIHGLRRRSLLHALDCAELEYYRDVDHSERTH